MKKLKIKNLIWSGILLIIALVVFIVNFSHYESYVEEIDYTNKIHFKNIECDSDEISFRLEELSVFNTVQDTIIRRSHIFLSLYLKLKVVNNRDETIKFLIDKGNDKPSLFKSIFISKNKKDTISFYNPDLISEYYIKPKDSLNFYLSTSNNPFYGLERLFSDKKDYTKDMLELLSNFQLIYNNGEKEICVSQNSDTKKIISNSKSIQRLFR
jgi:hypothetical protein